MIGPIRILLTVVVAAVITAPAYAEDFVQRKAVLIHAEQQEIAIRAEALSCMAASTDEATLKACRDKEHEQLEAVRAQIKQKLGK